MPVTMTLSSDSSESAACFKDSISDFVIAPVPS